MYAYVFFFFSLVAIVPFTSYTFIEAAAEQQQLHSKEREDRGDVLSDYGNVLSIAWISGKTICLDYMNQLVNLYSNPHSLVFVSVNAKKTNKKSFLVNYKYNILDLLTRQNNVLRM